MATLEEVVGAAQAGHVISRKIWASERALVGCKIGRASMCFLIVIDAEGHVHGDDMKLQRWVASEEDKAATDWGWADIDAEEIHGPLQ